MNEQPPRPLPSLTLARLALLALLLVLLAVSLWLLFGWYTPLSQAQALQLARARWDARPFEQYRVSVEEQDHTYGIGTRATYMVWDEAADMSRAGLVGKTVPDFFNLIEQQRGTRNTESRIGFCPQKTTLSVQAIYDEQLGYPRSIELFTTTRPDWLNINYWRCSLETSWGPSCANLACTTTTQKTITITVLPGS